MWDLEGVGGRDTAGGVWEAFPNPCDVLAVPLRLDLQTFASKSVCGVAKVVQLLLHQRFGNACLR